MQCEPPGQRRLGGPAEQDVVWGFRHLLHHTDGRDGPASPTDSDAGLCARPEAAPRVVLPGPVRVPPNEAQPMDPREDGPAVAGRPETTSGSEGLDSATGSPDQPSPARPPPCDPLADAARARRFARRWWRQVSVRHQRHVSAPDDNNGGGDDNGWTVLESDGLGPAPEPEPEPALRLPRLQRPAALRQAVAALQRGRSAVSRLAAVGQHRLTSRRRPAADPEQTGPAAQTRPVLAVRCSTLLSPEPGLPLFESVSCDNLAAADGAGRRDEGTVGGSGDGDELGAGGGGGEAAAGVGGGGGEVAAGVGGSDGGSGGGSPPSYPSCVSVPLEPPPPYSLVISGRLPSPPPAVTRPTPAQRLLWHGLDAQHIPAAAVTPATRSSRPTPAERLLWHGLDAQHIPEAAVTSAPTMTPAAAVTPATRSSRPTPAERALWGSPALVRNELPSLESAKDR